MRHPLRVYLLLLYMLEVHVVLIARISRMLLRSPKCYFSAAHQNPKGMVLTPSGCEPWDKLIAFLRVHAFSLLVASARWLSLTCRSTSNTHSGNGKFSGSDFYFGYELGSPSPRSLVPNCFHHFTGTPHSFCTTSLYDPFHQLPDS